MVKIKKIGFKDLLLYNQEKILNFKNSVIVANATKQDIYLTNIFPIRTSFYMFVLIENGWMTIELNYSRHQLTKQEILFILPDHIFLSIKSSKTVGFKIIFIEQEYFNSMDIGSRHVFTSNFFGLRKNPVVPLNTYEYELLSSCHNKLKKVITAPHHLKMEMVNILLWQYIIESCNIITSYNKDLSQAKILSRREILVRDFIELLNDNIFLEHKVGFYADKLNISAQYLTLVLREITGEGTKEWISKCIIVEAKIMLRQSYRTVQQIADALNFHDQSAFGKFFKLHTRQTPKEYQNNL